MTETLVFTSLLNYFFLLFVNVLLECSNLLPPFSQSLCKALVPLLINLRPLIQPVPRYVADLWYGAP